jgi:hydroxymethylglutaryl-CoA lyase
MTTKLFQFDKPPTIVEMLPRDGLQNLDRFVPTEQKVKLINQLSQTGVDEIEFTSFTHPKAVPNLRDASEVANRIIRHDDVIYRALVPNTVGMERAINADVDKVNALITVSETYSRKNQNATVEECIDEISDVIKMGHEVGIPVEAGIATSFYCPYEGRIDLADTFRMVDAMVEAGADEITLATTMGLADPKQLVDAFDTIEERWGDQDCGVHLHNTNGMSLANTLAALSCGVTRFDTSICGLGGGVVLPEELDGVGNTPTEDLLHMFSRMDLVDQSLFDGVTACAEEVTEMLSIDRTSYTLRGGTAENVVDVMSSK